jgi:hypothetical protein
MIALFLTAVCVFATYIIATTIIFNEIPKSISETYYMWQRRGMGYIFTLFMFLCAFLLSVPWLSCSDTYTECLAFLSCGAMMFVGAAAQFKERLTNVVHYTSAGVWAVSAIIWTIINDVCISILVGLIYGLVFWAVSRKSFTFWSEFACVMMMICAIGIKLFIQQ